MKFQKDRLWIVWVILIAWLPYFMGAWDKTKPADNVVVDAMPKELRDNFAVIESAVGNEHNFDTSTQTGVHENVTSTSIGIGTDGSVQGILTMWFKDSNEFPYIKIDSPDGTPFYFFVDNTGDLKMKTSAPTANGDGNPVGGQS